MRIPKNKRVIWELFLISLLTVVGSIISIYLGWILKPWEKSDLKAGEIELSEAHALDVIWVDSRSIEKFKMGHIFDTFHINENNWGKEIPRLMEVWLETRRPIVVYCDSKDCNTSNRIAERLREAIPDGEIYTLSDEWKTRTK